MKAVYIDAQSYAGGTANSVRVTAMLEALEDGGHEVTSFREQVGGSHARAQSAVGRVMAGILPNAVFLGSGVLRWLDNLTDTPDVVICYGVDPRYLTRVERWCRRHTVPLIVDVVDWYAPADVARLGPKLFCLVNDRWVMRSLVRRCSGAIVVSRLLEQHFATLGVPTLRVPAVVGGLPVAVERQDGGLVITYAGAPGLREARCLQNLQRLARDGELARLGAEVKIIGVERPESFAPDVEPGITYLGRLSREDTLQLVRDSTFTVLQRAADRRFARAGFPSKVAESLLLGVPVISNLTSDLGEFLTDRRNAIVLSDDTYESLLDGVRRSVEWASGVDRAGIRQDAVAWFGPASIRDRLSTFLSSIVQNG